MAFDDLTAVKDDMVAFIAGHGLRRMNAFVPEDVPTVLFEEHDMEGLCRARQGGRRSVHHHERGAVGARGRLYTD